MLNDFVLIKILLLYLYLSCYFLNKFFYLLFNFSFYRFAHELEGVAIGYGLIIIIGVDIVTEDFPRGSFFF